LDEKKLVLVEKGICIVWRLQILVAVRFFISGNEQITEHKCKEVLRKTAM